MNYPIWETTFWGGGTWIALIAVLHVYIAHLAVGGGLLIWITELKTGGSDGKLFSDYLRRHRWFFLYLTMVFGGVSGVGIWFIIGLVDPSATSLLIHNFVFGWAIEWVFFLGEIVALLLYAYRFDHMEPSVRRKVAFFYALFAWLSLVVINGILSFMLTPGKWLVTGNFWDGFLNPTFFPSLFFRTFMACVIAGIFGYVTALRVKDEGEKGRLMRYCTKWLVYPLPGALLALLWYAAVVPGPVRHTAFVLNRQFQSPVYVFLAATVALFLIGVVMSVRSGRIAQRISVGLVVAIGLGWIGGFEYAREIARKPFVIEGRLYSNSLTAASIEEAHKKGVLALARWVAERNPEGPGRDAAGRELFNIQCLPCHTIGGVRNDIVKKTAGLTYAGLLSQLTGQGKMLDYMPPVAGTRAEKAALAAYIARVANRPPDSLEPARAIKPSPKPLPLRDASRDDYVLLVWNDLGMHCMTDCDQAFVLLPPANTLEAQLIKRGATPRIVGGNEYEVTYKAEEGFENPSGHSRFWDFVESNFGVKLPKNVGLAGFGISGSLKYEEDKQSYLAKFVPIVPYPDGGGFNPYPMFHVEAKERSTGKVIAASPVVAPVSTELGCRKCHGGPWGVDNMTGASKETAGNILIVHDRLNKTDLHQQASLGKPHLCQSCHPDPAIGSKGTPGVINFAAAMHGWHANYMYEEGPKACSMCHPADPQGPTRCSRGIHAVSGLTCVNCHGTLSDHALSLLKGQSEFPVAQRLMKNLTPVVVASKEVVIGRTPWINEPDCLNCHQQFSQPAPSASGFNKWTKGPEGLYRGRADGAGLRCTACHGSPHAEYPAINPYVAMKDNMVPLEYTGRPYPIGSESRCETCHMKKMQNPIHHKNMLRPFRNVARWEEAVSRAR